MMKAYAAMLWLAAPAWAATEWDRYFPTPVGAEWRYDVRDKKAGDRFEMRVVIDPDWREGELGGPVMRQRDKRGTMKQFLLRRDDGVFLHKLGLSKSYTPEVTTRFTPAAPVLPFPLTPHALPEWQGRLKVAWVDKRIRYTGQVMGEEEVKVPAGAFRCVRVFFDQWRDDEHVQETVWYAPDVGQVRYDGGQYVKELIEYKPGK